MEWIIKECVETAGCELEVSAAFIGEDVLICLKGGERPHLGCVVQTEPRVSLTGDGSVSATSSVLNFPVFLITGGKTLFFFSQRVFCIGIEDFQMFLFGKKGLVLMLSVNIDEQRRHLF